MTTHLHASWIDGKAFRENWQPLANAEEFFLLSCYVSTAGWEELERILSQSSSLTRAMLFFSMEGLSAVEIVSQIDAVYSLVGKQRPGGLTQAFLILDRSRALFHPKAHASRSGWHSRVVVGSANLTGAGLSTNHELISVIDDESHIYRQFVDFINKLPSTAHVVSVNATPREVMLRYAQGRAPIPSSRRNQSPRDEESERRPRFVDPPPAAVQESMFPSDGRSVAESEEALQSVRKLASQGAILVRMDEVEPMTMSTNLARFRKAGIIAPLEIKTIRPGITVEKRQGFTLSLLPDGVRDRRTELRQTNGRLAGRFSIDVLGVHWIPFDWQGTLLRHWKDIAQALGLVVDQDIKAAIKTQLEGMRAELEDDSELYHSLIEEVRINPPSAWNEDKARRILAPILHVKKEEPLPLALSEKQMIALRALIWDDVRGHIGRRLQFAYVITQLEQAGLPPHFRRFSGDNMDERDALLWLAQWTLSGVGSAVRSPQAREGVINHLPNRNGVGEILAGRFGRFSPRGADVHEAYNSALRWKQTASGTTEGEDIEQSLAEA